MRVWLVPSAYAPAIGGVEEATARLAEQLCLRGHDVLVITHRWPDALPALSWVDGLPVHRLPFTALGRHPRSWAPHLRGLFDVQRRLAALPVPDVVHVHCVAGQAMHLARFCRRNAIRLVVTTHGETAMDAAQIYQRSPLQRRVLRSVAARADALTACSSWARTHAAGLAPAFVRADIVPNGVRVADWAGLPDVREPVFAAYGRHVPQKGFDVLLRAFDIVRATRPDAELLLGGSGEQSTALRTLSGEGVQLLGRLDRAGVRQLLASARVVVVPSLVEPFGIVALEALAAGRRLVHSNVGGLADLGASYSWPVTPGDSAALATAMLAALEGPPRAPHPEQVELRWSWSSVVDQYLSCYEPAVDR